jgi:TolA-binding protein
MQSDVTQLSIQDQLLTWFEKNKRQVLWGVVAVAVVGAAAGIYFWKQNETQTNASHALSKIASDNLMGAARPDTSEALLKVATDYAGTDAARRAVLLAAGNYFTEGKYKESQGQFERFLREYRESSFATEALFGVAACKDAQGMTNEALVAYKDIVDHHPSESVAPQARFALGRLYEAQNKLELARDCFQQVAQMDPNGQLGSEAGMRLAEIYSANPSLIPNRPAPAASPMLSPSKP